MRITTWLGHIAALLLSLMAAFVVVFNVLFSDALNPGSQLGAILYVLVAYAALSLIFHGLWRGRGWTWTLWLVIPALVAEILIFIFDSNRFLYPLAIMLAVVGPVLGGKWLFDRRPRRPNITPSNGPAT